jgi:hypothetical protein
MSRTIVGLVVLVASIGLILMSSIASTHLVAAPQMNSGVVRDPQAAVPVPTRGTLDADRAAPPSRIPVAFDPGVFGVLELPLDADRLEKMSKIKDPVCPDREPCGP